MAQILLKVPISVCQNAVQCSHMQEYHKVVSEGPPLLSMIFQRVFALQFLFYLLMILNDCRLSIHINQGLNIILLWSCNTNSLYNEAEFSYSCTILAKSFNSPNKTLHKKDLSVITFTDNLQWSEHYSYKIIAEKA